MPVERRIAPGPRVQFERALEAQMMAIDGTWMRNCIVHDVSDGGARLTILGSLENLQVKEFFLSFTSRGLAYRRCEMRWCNGENLGVKFIKQVKTKGTPARGGAQRAGDPVGA